ncbi:DEAD/DEAH box helicase family protein [Terasakiella pusilla]|uniref:DEAD/DEAH box helicase family protein n=1 Tax=Terasakiella pusilla TaxID=64973 RepID=UPI003AA97DCE
MIKPISNKRCRGSDKTIKYVDALAGTGKTRNACNWSIEQVLKNHQNIVIVQPSTDLTAQTEINIQATADSLGTPVKVVRIDNTIERIEFVTKEIREYLIRIPSDYGVVLIITHQAFLKLKDFPNKEKWTLIVDEIPDVDQGYKYQIPLSQGLLTPLLDLCDLDNGYSLVTAKKGSAIDGIIDKADDCLKAIEPLLKLVRYKTYDIYALNHNFERISNHEDTDKDSGQFWFFSLLRPEKVLGFKETIIMGASFKRSILYRLWHQQGVNFVKHDVISPTHSNDTHTNGKRLKIHFWTEDAWSLEYQKKTFDVEGAETNVMDILHAELVVRLGNKDFLWWANNHWKDKWFKGQSNGINLKHNPFGLNSYQHIDTVVFMSALNPTSPHYTFMRNMGVGPTEMRDALVHQVLYQAVMRSSLRDAGSTRPVDVFVPDRQSADYLQDLFPGSEVECFAPDFINDEVDKKPVGRPKKSKNAAERKKLCVKKKAVRAKQANVLGITPRITIFESPYDTVGVDYEINDVDQFMTQLKETSHDWFENKSDNVLVSSAKFDAQLSDKTSRGRDNVTTSWGLWLDHDGGGISWEDFHEVFSDFSHMICNTYSGRDRYRVFFPTKTSMTSDVHRISINWIFDQLKEWGYEDHGFDLTKIDASALFYLPAQAANQDDSFFHVFGGQTLDPNKILEDVNLDGLIAEEIKVPCTGKLSNASVEKSVMIYQSIPAGHGQRHRAFFHLGLALYKQGGDWEQIETILTQADNDGSRAIKGEIQRVICSLQSGKYW